MTTSEIMVSELYDRVWSDGDYSAVARLIAPHYAIYSDPGDGPARLGNLAAHLR